MAEGAKIQEILVLSERETPAYIQRVYKSNFFMRQFINMQPTENFIVGDDIDAVSGATVSSLAITEAVRRAVHQGAVDHLGLPVTWEQDQWQVGINEIGLVALFALAFIGAYRRDKIGKYCRWITPPIALVFVGFYTNSSVSLGNLAGIVMGYIPDVKTHPLWWIMMGGVLGSAILLGRNIYCNQLCPFSTMQDLMQKISGIRWRFTHDMQRRARQLIMFMSWVALMLIFLSAHPAMGSYEPFSMMFALEGVGIQWYILPATLIGMFFVPSFWCRMFCPVGFWINEVVRVRRSIRDLVTGKGKKKREIAAAYAAKEQAAKQAESGAKPKRKAKKKQPLTWQGKVSTSLAVLVLLLIVGYFIQSFIYIREAAPVSVAIERITNGKVSTEQSPEQKPE